MDKMAAWNKIKFNVIFVGNDWKGTERWNIFEDQFEKVGVEIIYLPYTKGTSSSLINDILLKIRNKN